MKKASRVLLVFIIVISFSFTSCNPEDTFTEELTQIQNMEQCCGELGELPSEPGDEDETITGD